MPSEPVVTVPDAHDLGIRTDPLRVWRRTDTGATVRPVVVLANLNRHIKRRLARDAKPLGDLAPVYLSRPRPDREVNEEMADMVLQEWETYHRHFPLATLSNYLDARTSETMAEAFRRGTPINRDAVRQALAHLHEEAKREQRRA